MEVIKIIKANLKNDVYFKEFFSKKCNEKYLVDFLSCLLKKKICEAEVIKDYALTRDVVTLKTGALDIRAKLKDGTVIIIEMQVKNNHNMEDRLIYYNAKSVSEQLKRGEDYTVLKPVISVAILDYKLLECDRYVSTACLKQEDGIVLNEKIIYKIIELPKIRKNNLEYKNGLECWLTFIDGKNKEGIKMAVKQRPILKEAQEDLKKLEGDIYLERLAEFREKEKWDLDSLKAYTKKVARQEGRAEGRKEGILDVAKNMLNENYNINLIAKVTKLSIKEIKAIRSQITFK